MQVGKCALWYNALDFFRVRSFLLHQHHYHCYTYHSTIPTITILCLFSADQPGLSDFVFVRPPVCPSAILSDITGVYNVIFLVYLVCLWNSYVLSISLYPSLFLPLFLHSKQKYFSLELYDTPR